MEFEEGPLAVRVFQVAGATNNENGCCCLPINETKKKKNDDELEEETLSESLIAAPPPPKPLLIAAPEDPGQYPVLVFCHGFLLVNTHYSELLQHVASHGFVLVAPQMYVLTCAADASGEIDDAASIINWLSDGLVQVVQEGEGLSEVQPRLDMLALVGHSRGGKVAFGVSLGLAKISIDLNICALVGFDPVDGTDTAHQTPPPILTFTDHSFDLNNIPVLIVGCGLSSSKPCPLFPPCAADGVNHRQFFAECPEPAFHFVAPDFGHMDFLDDRTTDGVRGLLTYCLCKNGASRRPLRRFAGGILVDFLKAALFSDTSALEQLIRDPSIAPVKLDDPQWHLPSLPSTSAWPDLQHVFSSQRSPAGNV